MTLKLCSYWFAKFNLYSFEFVVESVFKKGLNCQNIKLWEDLAQVIFSVNVYFHNTAALLLLNWSSRPSFY